MEVVVTFVDSTLGQTSFEICQIRDSDLETLIVWPEAPEPDGF